MNISPSVKAKLKKRAISVVVPAVLVILSPAMAMVGVVVGAVWLVAFEPNQAAQTDIIAYPLLFGAGFGAVTFAVGALWLAISLLRIRLLLTPLGQVKRRLR